MNQRGSKHVGDKRNWKLKINLENCAFRWFVLCNLSHRTVQKKKVLNGVRHEIFNATKRNLGFVWLKIWTTIYSFSIKTSAFYLYSGL